jgi:hypothetical protein
MEKQNSGRSYLYYNWSSRTSGKTNLTQPASGPAVWFVEDPAAPLPPATEEAGSGVYNFYYHHVSYSI